jgi:excisionase family DNA binding protein
MAISTMTPREVARTLGIRLDAVYSLIWAGKLLAEKAEGRWLVSQAAVQARADSRAHRSAQCAAAEGIQED